VIPTSVSDLELINRVKQQNDSAALSELTNRHSGIYVKIASQYTGFSDKISLDDLKEDKQYNIYEWIVKYDATRGMKLGTYIGEMTKYMCLTLLGKTPDYVSLDQTPEVAAPAPVAPTTQSTISDLKNQINVPNPKFWPIFEARHSGDKPKTWRKIGQDMGITHEWARQIYQKYLPKVQETIRL
jgi:DNA-directed RNA polymerase sigma subunit (sigma70/sigma32)